MGIATCNKCRQGLNLAAIRHRFDWLVMGQAVPLNPAASVRGPTHSAQMGKTPVLKPAEGRALLDSIDVSTPIGLCDWGRKAHPRKTARSRDHLRSVWCSRRVRLTGAGRIVVGQPWIPPLEQGAGDAVEGSGSGLQQHVGAAPGPLHLLALGKALADHRVDRALGYRRRDALASAEPLAVVDQAAGVRPDVDCELLRRPGELARVRVVHLGGPVAAEPKVRFST